MNDLLLWVELHPNSYYDYQCPVECEITICTYVRGIYGKVTSVTHARRIDPWTIDSEDLIVDIERAKRRALLTYLGTIVNNTCQILNVFDFIRKDDNI